MNLGERKTTSVTIGSKELTFETGKIAKQANGSVLVRMGDTVVFGAASASKEANEEIDFFPLRVDYQEKFSSAGKTLSGFIKREGRPSERDILLSRLIDRPIRPMFPEGYYNEVQLLCYVWSYDSETPPDPLGICAASAALVISDIPLLKPIGAVRVGMIDGQFIVNPSIEEMKSSKLDLLIAGTEEAILMIEGYCDFLTEEEVLSAINTGHNSIQKICRTLEEWQKEVGKEKNTSTLRVIAPELEKEIERISGDLIHKAVQISAKKERELALGEAKKKALEEITADEERDPSFSETNIKTTFKQIASKALRTLVMEGNKRPDQRTPEQIRPIDIEQALLPRTHGSSLFTRGETQSVSVCTLGGTNMAQRFEDLEKDDARTFYLHYTFPPFSVGEVGRVGAPSRREIGHGKLAERALSATLPAPTEFPYTIRLESNITESNGSSSMATVCGGALAMMDAGVPIKRPVSGIAMGLILEKDRYMILSDITGTEDALGDMDFKITGDAEGITAFQMDIKVEGITKEIMSAALHQAKEGRIHILKEMLKTCPESRKDMSRFAPKIETFQVKVSKIGAIIGPGGKQIREIIDRTGVEIDINDDGKVNVIAKNADAMEAAKEIIFGLIAEIEIGKTYKGKITSIAPFGAFIEILPGQEGLCHISEISHERIGQVTDVLKEGEMVQVKVMDINERGQVKLSRKALLSKA